MRTINKDVMPRSADSRRVMKKPCVIKTRISDAQNVI